MSELMPYQIAGAEWLAGRDKALLGDHMGLGKTPQAIRAADLVGARRVAVICPAIGRMHWQREYERWSLMGPDLEVWSYERLAVSKKARDEFRHFRPQVCIADEMHYMKSRESLRTRRMYGQHCHGNGLLMVPEKVWLLSGTPMPNNVTELWPHLRANWPHLIMSNGQPMNYMEFVQRFAEYETTDFGVKVFGNKRDALPQARAILGDIMLRRSGAEVLRDLPPIFWQPTYMVEPDKISTELLRMQSTPEVEELQRILDAASDGETRGLFVDEEPVALASVRRLTAELKARPVARMIAEELHDGAYNKIVIFAHHIAALDILGEELAAFKPCQIRGGQTEGYRQGEIDAFQNDPHRRVMLVQQKAGYHTITLTAAAQVAFLEQSWVPDENIQAAKRCHRIGQMHPVFVRNFGLAGSIDEAVSQVLSRKAQAILEILE